MVRFLAAGAAGRTCLGAAKVFGAWQFVAGVIDHFIRTHLGWRVGTEPGDLWRNDYDDEQQKRIQQPRSEHAPVRENTVGSFTGQACAGAGKSRTDGSDELLPGRGPLDQELGRVMKLDRVFELESIGH